MRGGLGSAGGGENGDGGECEEREQGFHNARVSGVGLRLDVSNWEKCGFLKKKSR